MRRLGAAQAQEYVPAKWGLAQRLEKNTNASMEKALASGDILRTHVLRPTWHFVPRDDIRWMVELTAPRIQRVLSYYGRKLGVTPVVLRKSAATLRRALRGGRSLTRAEVKETLKKAGLGKDLGLRFWRIMGSLELDGIVCSGPHRGKQSTWALTEERAPRAKRLPRDEALAELSRRYFTSHGPATIHDYGWWSGLSIADVRRGIELAGSALKEEKFEGRSFVSARDERPFRGGRSPVARLLPPYDEFLIAYKDRSAAFDPKDAAKLTFYATIAIGARVVGSWRSVAGRKGVAVEASLFRPLEGDARDALDAAVQRYAAFLGTPVTLKTSRARRGSAGLASVLYASARPSG